MTWEAVERTAYGVLGMDSEKFWQETPREFALRLEGYTEREKVRSREQWEQTRIMAYYMAAPHLKKTMTITRFFPLPWDNEKPDRPKLSKEQIERLLKKLDQGWPHELATS